MITQGLEQNTIQIISFLSIREKQSKQQKHKTGSKHKNGHKNGQKIAFETEGWLDPCSLKEPGETSQSRCIMELVWAMVCDNVRQPSKTMEPDGFLSESHMNTIKRFDQFWTTTDPNGYLTQKPLKAMVTHKNIATFQNFYHCSSLLYKVILHNVLMIRRENDKSIA